MSPTKIMIIRHAEKPNGEPGIAPDGSPDPKSLTQQGWARAKKLVEFFKSPTSANIQRPDWVFAAAPDVGSKRPAETVAPLVDALWNSADKAQRFNTSIPEDEPEQLATSVMAVDGVVLISWEHQSIPDCVAALPNPPASPPRWPGSRFDVVWILNAKPSGGWDFSQTPQMLLAGDENAVIYFPLDEDSVIPPYPDIQIRFEPHIQLRAEPRGLHFPLNTYLPIDKMSDFALARRLAVPPGEDRPPSEYGIGLEVAVEGLDPREISGPSKIGNKTAKKAAKKGAKKAAKKTARAPASGKPTAGAKVPPASPPAEPAEDIVECSVFGPSAAPPGKTILIQVFLHLADQAERASFLATATDASAKLKSAKPLDLPIKRGARVEIAFAANGLTVDEPVQSVVWRGEPTFCQFQATIPKGTNGDSFLPIVRVSIDGKLVGRIAFSLSSDDAASRPASEPLGDHAKLYKYAFVSYASKDREEVLKRVQMLEVLKTKFFQDILSLEPGDRWEKKLYENIDRCDLFLLFWSQAAKDSQWVLKEAEYALAHQQKNPGSEPDLVPVVLEQNVPPPENLSAFHFNDRISYLISRKL
jgi:hypothetical protein